MYHYVLAACLVFDASGEPVNPCYMKESPQYYQTMEQCRSEAQGAKNRAFKNLAEKYSDAAVVISVPCGKVKGNSY